MASSATNTTSLSSAQAEEILTTRSTRTMLQLERSGLEEERAFMEALVDVAKAMNENHLPFCAQVDEVNVKIREVNEDLVRLSGQQS